MMKRLPPFCFLNENGKRSVSDGTGAKERKKRMVKFKKAFDFHKKAFSQSTFSTRQNHNSTSSHPPNNLSTCFAATRLIDVESATTLLLVISVLHSSPCFNIPTSKKPSFPPTNRRHIDLRSRLPRPSQEKPLKHSSDFSSLYSGFLYVTSQLPFGALYFAKDESALCRGRETGGKRCIVV
ncbi:hypothetical protein SKAU_G00231690 [Synaphobranchus kaupii]|uniref:Uncharacterized protein n=1 Tax=Synaphobranchus kaupii TaxID=118154 RepID=A0A9Q1F5T0_SYNKA|nr:hypothetical protein SKAU_G00231690 [Synaphobranchus kaupii]